MKNKLFILSTLVTCFSFSLFSQITSKKTLSHSDYNGWKKLEHPAISANGKWVSYEVNPQKGDGYLYLINTLNVKKDSVARGYDAKFSPNSDFLIFKIKPQEDTTRNAKLKKVKKEKFPKDSVAIWVLKTDSIFKFPSLKSFILAEENVSCYAFLSEKKEISDSSSSKYINDSTSVNTVKINKPKKKKSKYNEVEVFDLTFGNLSTNHHFYSVEVTECVFSKSGNAFAFITLKKDSIDTASVYIFDVTKESLNCIVQKKGYAKKLVMDHKGDQLSYIFTSDTAKTKHYCLYYYNRKSDEPKMIVDTLTTGMKKKWEISEHANYYFSDDGSKLFLGTAPIQRPEPKDSLADDEKVKIDLWNWKDQLIQSQQLKETEKEKKKHFLAVYHISRKTFIQLADSIITDIYLMEKGNGIKALGISRIPYLKQNNQEDQDYKDIYITDISTGNKNLLLTKKSFHVSLSPAGKYLIWYESADSSWYTMNLNTNTMSALTKSLQIKFCQEENDLPKMASPDGIAGWTENDKEVLIYAR